ncbi:hypothetical protein M409DRAFT_52235 [Zasmidium cellare ATCC 36951]|uniref:Uncharacterized protein n=1 Tax=Zasmidium cellare ATCC 36951 TaxID=1080233 RepID=A0A6A6CW47_ZASCE|nr:uncharacterized protein M409DRAFT_52235 [Zasmidium cellare ATCC 36951]KAF2169726.1 hypothetical protein M409DRAFT_52235 [Zasmidium cellare ATCC 36951]
MPKAKMPTITPLSKSAPVIPELQLPPPILLPANPFGDMSTSVRRDSSTGEEQVPIIVSSPINVAGTWHEVQIDLIQRFRALNHGYERLMASLRAATNLLNAQSSSQTGQLLGKQQPERGKWLHLPRGYQRYMSRACDCGFHDWPTPEPPPHHAISPATHSSPTHRTLPTEHLPPNTSHHPPDPETEIENYLDAFIISSPSRRGPDLLERGDGTLAKAVFVPEPISTPLIVLTTPDEEGGRSFVLSLEEDGRISGGVAVGGGC